MCKYLTDTFFFFFFKQGRALPAIPSYVLTNFQAFVFIGTEASSQDFQSETKQSWELM